VVSGAWSDEVTRLAVWLAGQVSYEQASQIMSQVGQMDISGSSIWRRVQQWGERLLEHEQWACAQANTVPEREVPQRGEARHDQPMGVSVDGWMVPIREEGWKEVKTGTVFCVEQQEILDNQTGEPVERAVARDCTYIAHLGGPEDFGAKLWTEASRRKVPGAYEKAWVSDGAAWIWSLCQDYFPEAEQIVDWYHALAHLHSAATLLHGEGTDKAKRWAESMKTTLFQVLPGLPTHWASSPAPSPATAPTNSGRRRPSSAITTVACAIWSTARMVGPLAVAPSRVAASNSSPA
jgi:hypothetical protein